MLYLAHSGEILLQNKYIIHIWITFSFIYLQTSLLQVIKFKINHALPIGLEKKKKGNSRNTWCQKIGDLVLIKSLIKEMVKREQSAKF